MDKFKICYVISTNEGGTWAFEQLRDLRNRYHCDVNVVLSSNEGSLIDRFKAEKIPIFVANFDFLRPTDIFTLPKKILRLAIFFRKNKFDVVQTHLFNSMVIGRVASWLADVPIHFSMIAGPFHLEAKISFWIDKITAWMDTAVFPSCEFTRDLYIKMGLSPNRLHVIYYGPDHVKFNPESTQIADIRKEFGWSPKTPLIGMVAYFYPKLGKNGWTPAYLNGKAIKGHEDLIRAAAIVRMKYPECKFLLIGKGWGESGEKVKDDMQVLVKKLGLENTVFFTGYRKDIPQIYKDLDISVQPSINENLGGTIESLLMECPTVVTRVGGLVDTVVDGKTGIQVNPSDPQDLAKGILKLLDDPKKAKELGLAGRNYMLERFTLAKTVFDLYTIFSRYSYKLGKRYRLMVSIYRFLALAVFGFFISLRFFILEIWLYPIYAQFSLKSLKNKWWSLVELVLAKIKKYRPWKRKNKMI